MKTQWHVSQIYSLMQVTFFGEKQVRPDHKKRLIIGVLQLFERIFPQDLVKLTFSNSFVEFHKAVLIS